MRRIWDDEVSGLGDVRIVLTLTRDRGIKLELGGEIGNNGGAVARLHI